MKKFLEDFLDWLKIMGLTIVLAPIWYFILTYGFNVDLANLSKNDFELLVVLPPFFISTFLIYLFDKKEVEQEEEPKEDEIISVSEEKEPEEKATPEKLKTDNPNTNDPSKLYIFSGEKGKIIMVRDGKVIYEEDMKVDPDMYSRNSSYPDHL